MFWSSAAGVVDHPEIIQRAVVVVLEVFLLLPPLIFLPRHIQ
jgi:hypothetical protein